ncbi:NeuD/PglB/VioB family sugar acetyltransferase [Schleiferia thermophila]|jgi:sugar O-acyltransferase (sialic acid O-acetyltransferase NeuD family)|uniref:NeuD/PglB/VioB family sugar acetyltransferase n=1 Tax=Schleiferia thermophila TaxID=884107 RepID=UPI000CBC1123|nr:hypothetical protein CEN47_11195 [Fischerella thermalis CCMEE 5319]
MKEKIFIIGAGSVGGHIASNLKLYGIDRFQIKFLDDDVKKIGSTFMGYPIVDKIEFLLTLDEPAFVVMGVAFPNIKKSIFDRISLSSNIEYMTLIAKNAWISEDVEIGKGCIVYPGCMVNYGATLKNFVILNMNCAIGHHAEIGNFSSLAPGVCIGGHTKIGDCVDMGIGSCTLQNIIIGDNSVVGGQAMITRSIPDNSKVVGVPAKILQ